MDATRKILKLISEGIVSIKEGNSLLKSIEIDKKEKKETRKLVIKLLNEKKDQSLLKITIPLNLVKTGMRLIPREKKINMRLADQNYSLEAIDWEDIFKQASDSELGDIFNLEYLTQDNERMKLEISLI